MVNEFFVTFLSLETKMYAAATFINWITWPREVELIMIVLRVHNNKKTGECPTVE